MNYLLINCCNSNINLFFN